MRVGLDAHMVGAQETGNETYVKGLVEGFLQLTPVDLVVYATLPRWVASNDHIHFERLITGNPLVRLGFELSFRSIRDRLDVLHMTYASPLWSPARTVVTVHDICFVTNPEWFSRRDLRVLSATVPRSIRAAAHVITVSDDARRRIIEHYGVPEDNISTVYNGPGEGAKAINAELAASQLVTLGLDPARPFVLTVGNVQPRKNLGRLIRAFANLERDVDLVVVGPKRFQADEIVQSATSLAGRIHFTGYVSDAQLAACYARCSLFVLPSLYEGFGLPAVEAMAHGAAVACSNTGALPEICGDAAVFFDPYSVEEIEGAMRRTLTDSDLRRRLSSAATERAAMFTWRRSAEQTLDVYKQAVG